MDFKKKTACSFVRAAVLADGVPTLDTPFGDSDMEALRQKLNEMILAARR